MNDEKQEPTDEQEHETKPERYRKIARPPRDRQIRRPENER